MELVLTNGVRRSDGKRIGPETGDPRRFTSFEEVYHQLMIDLTGLTADSIKLVITAEDGTRNLFVTGGFAKNTIFTKLLAERFNDKDVYTSEVANATSLGAALVLWKCLGDDREPALDLGLQKITTIKL